MVQPKEHDKLVENFRERVAFGKSIGVTTFVGLTGNARDDISYDRHMTYVVQCLRRLAPIAEENGVTIVMESLNTLVDHHGYFLSRTDQAMLILEAVNSPNVKMLFDIYHQQIMEGNVIRNLGENIERIGHIHVGDNPGRKQPGTGELNYPNIFKSIASTNYQGYGPGVRLHHCHRRRSPGAGCRLLQLDLSAPLTDRARAACLIEPRPPFLLSGTQ